MIKRLIGILVAVAVVGIVVVVVLRRDNFRSMIRHGELPELAVPERSAPATTSPAEPVPAADSLQVIAPDSI